MATIAQFKEVERVAVVIPAFCEAATVGDVVAGVRKYLDDVFVIDDASTDSTYERASEGGATVISREVNGGKSAALTEGFKVALAQGFDAVITIDADGFHDPGEIPQFLEAYHRTHLPVLIGNRMGGNCHLTVIRKLTIRLMRFWLDRHMGVYVPDPPCGFRFYRCDVLPFLLEERSSLPAEFETLLNIASRRIRVGPVRISKCSDRHKSMISPFRDIVRFARVMVKYYHRHPDRKVRFVEEEI